MHAYHLHLHCFRFREFSRVERRAALGRTTRARFAARRLSTRMGPASGRGDETHARARALMIHLALH